MFKRFVTDLLQILNKLLAQKNRQINKIKQKTSLQKTNIRKVIIKNLKKPDKTNCKSLY